MCQSCPGNLLVFAGFINDNRLCDGYFFCGIVKFSRVFQPFHEKAENTNTGIIHEHFQVVWKSCYRTISHAYKVTEATKKRSETGCNGKPHPTALRYDGNVPDQGIKVPENAVEACMKRRKTKGIGADNRYPVALRNVAQPAFKCPAVFVHFPETSGNYHCGFCSQSTCLFKNIQRGILI